MKTLTLAFSLAFTLPMAAADYSRVIPKLEAVIAHEMEQWGIGGIAVALVDDQETVYIKGFGEAKDDSLFRVGSISKLFNALAVMQLVEAGKLDLDAPIDPAMLPANPFPKLPAVTLRQLLSHRSGLQREATVGSYFDPNEPTIEATVASLREGVLATLPGETTRYSNIGATLAGHLLEKVCGQDFVSYQNEKLLDPLGMKRSAWLLRDVLEDGLVKAHMRVADGKGGWIRREAPVFDLGTLPAGNLYASAGDIARFASVLLAEGGGLVRPETLAEMWKPQFTNGDSGFGLGFAVGKFRHHRLISHGGAVYGFSTSIALLPEAAVAAIVFANEDIASGRVARIRTEALSALLEVKHGKKPPIAPAEFVEPNLAPYIGDYESPSYWARLWISDGKLVGDISGQPTQFRATAKHTFLAESRIDHETKTGFDADASGFMLGSQRFQRAGQPTREIDHSLWRNFLGSYGHDFIPLIISERHGHLYAMTENMVDYRLTPVNQNVFALPEGMYTFEHLVFLTDGEGHCPRINFCSVFFDRN